MRLLYVYDRGMNCFYWDVMLVKMVEMYPDFYYQTVNLRDYPTFDHSGFDVLVYQTFPDETHPYKFDEVAVSKGDAKFLSFTGKNNDQQ